MNYGEWIERERRIRVKLLQDRQKKEKDGLYRVCDDCGEILLCHEEACPNCNSASIRLQVLEDESLEIKIRCLYRFQRMEKGESKVDG